MNEETFNIELRKFLKKFGVTAQRAIEDAVESGIARGLLRGNETLPVRATLTVPGILEEFLVSGEIELERRSDG